MHSLYKMIILAAGIWLSSFALYSNVSAKSTSIYVQNNTTEAYIVETSQTGPRLSAGDHWLQHHTVINPGKRARILAFTRDKGVRSGKKYFFDTAIKPKRIQGADPLILKQVVIGKPGRFKGEFILSNMIYSAAGLSRKQGWYADSKDHSGTWAIRKPVGHKVLVYRGINSGADVEYVLTQNISTPRAGANSFSVLSYNVYLRTPPFVNGQIKRAGLIPRHVGRAGTDVIVFQEAFYPPATTLLMSGIKNFYPYRTQVLNGLNTNIKQAGQKLNRVIIANGGVIIASKWTIEKTEELFFDDCTGWDCRAAKGALYARINKNGRRYHVIGTHLQSGSWSIQRKQLVLIRNWLDSKLNIQANEPLLFAGDFNVDTAGKEKNTEYHKMKQLLGAELGGFKATTIKSYDYRTNDLLKDNTQDQNTKMDSSSRRYDHVFYSTRHRPATRSVLEVLLVRPNKKWSIATIPKGHWDLSDHYPVRGEFNFP